MCVDTYAAKPTGSRTPASHRFSDKHAKAVMRAAIQLQGRGLCVWTRAGGGRCLVWRCRSGTDVVGLPMSPDQLRGGSTACDLVQFYLRHDWTWIPRITPATLVSGGASHGLCSEGAGAGGGAPGSAWPSRPCSICCKWARQDEVRLCANNLGSVKGGATAAAAGLGRRVHPQAAAQGGGGGGGAEICRPALQTREKPAPTWPLPRCRPTYQTCTTVRESAHIVVAEGVVVNPFFIS